MNNIEVIGLGALNMDHIHRVNGVLGDRETTVEVEQVTHPPISNETNRKWMGAFPGGSAANTIYGLARLGVKTGFIGIVGEDATGQSILEDFRGANVDTSRIKIKSGANTGSTLCFSDRLNFRSIEVTPGANSLLTMDDVNIGYINQTDLLHISSFADEEQFSLLLELITKLEPSIKLSFSPGTLYTEKGMAAISPILHRTGVLFINQDEMQQLTGTDFIAGTASCLKQGCQIVAVTMGKGTRYQAVTATSYISDGTNNCFIEVTGREQTPVLDTTGAGDAFAAGFLYGLLSGTEIKDCGRLGDTTARFAIAKTGARAGLPTLDELARRYQELYNREL